VELRNGKWYCASCGAELDLQDGQRPRQVMVGASGQKNMRVLYVEDREIHRCLFSPERPKPR
jgi:hypothetical protein